MKSQSESPISLPKPPANPAHELAQNLEAQLAALAHQHKALTIAAMELFQLTSGAKTSMVIEAREGLRKTTQALPDVMRPIWKTNDSLNIMLPRYVEAEQF